MAKKWNDINSIRNTRTQALSGAPSPVPVDFSDIPVVSKINNPPPQAEVNWRVFGVAPTKIDFDGNEIQQASLSDAFPARSRPSGFPLIYQNLDQLLDGPLISAAGLTFEPADEQWKGTP